MKLHVFNSVGNIYQAATDINKLGLAEYVISIQSYGNNTTVVLSMPEFMVYDLREKSKTFNKDPHFDDFKEGYHL